MKRILTVLAWMVALPLSASHIAGGEFQLIHLNGQNYRLQLVYYFDVVNGFKTPGTTPPDPANENITVYIYRMSDKQLVRNVPLTFKLKQRVQYTQPDCSKGEVVTDKLVFSQDIALSPDIYNDPAGYYVIWQRCCRNYTIDNIISEDPNKGLQGAGQLFYLEFPPVVRNGQPFINSSPGGFEPIREYACINQPFYTDFAGTDADGDSLAYTLITPFSTTTTDAQPGPSPGPFPNVEWQNGFGLNRIINGPMASAKNPDLSISPTGLLTVTPAGSEHISAFAVRVDEYRNGEKIGEVIRDFQILVLDCQMSNPPVITGQTKDNPGVSYRDNMSVSFAPGEERCITVTVTDPDSQRPEANFSEVVRLEAIALNFNTQKLPELLPTVKSGTLQGNGSLTFDICFPECPYLEGVPFQVGILAIDDACPLGLMDTLRVAVQYDAPPNAPVQFVTPNVTGVLQEGDQMIWEFEAHDADADIMLLSFKTDGFVLSTAGMTITEVSNENGVLKGTVSWDAYCDIYDFTNRSSFKLTLLVDDDDPCDFNDPAEMTFDLTVILPGNADPIADTDLTTQPDETIITGIQRSIYESLNFQVTAKDQVDNDAVTIRMAGRDFKPSDYGMSFEKKSGTGFVASDFAWDLQCEKIDPSLKNVFELLFIAIDSTNQCRVNKRDTVKVFVEAKRPTNNAPEISITSLNPNVPYDNGDMHMIVGQPLQLSMTVTDTDVSPIDEVRIDLVDFGGTNQPEGFTFTPVIGASPQTATLEWSPDCSIFTNEVRDNDYFFTFIYMDNRCQTEVADTVEVKVNIHDVETEDFNFTPPNVFTPNGDDYNEYFAMEGRLNNEVVNILPPDNCLGQFRNVRIYNRWGTTVFESTDRNFKWWGDGQAAGVYYYHVSYTNREYKGTVSLRN